MASNAPLEVFYSYAHEDEDLRDELEKHLKLLQRNGLIANWHDRGIGAGGEWRGEIDAHARSAHIILLLISADFVASDYCYGVEMKLALERHARHEAIVVPVILRPVDWSTAPFAHLQALPRDGKPITTWSNRDGALADVARGIREIVYGFRRPESRESDDRPPLVDEYVPKPPAASPVGQEEKDFRWPRPPETPLPTSPQREASADAGPIAYAGIALVGLLLALGFTFFYVYQVPKLVEGGAQGQIFYLLLIPWALGSAAFLFGAMRSYARFTYRHLGSVLELGGPVVLFCLVLLGGFKLVPTAPETFDLAVRAHSPDTPLITSGQITLELPGLPHANIGQDGEANFKGVSTKLKGKAIRVLPKVEGYEEKWLTPTIEGNVLTVELERAHPVFVQKASLVPPPLKGKTVQIRVDGQKIDVAPDELGGLPLLRTRTLVIEYL